MILSVSQTPDFLTSVQRLSDGNPFACRIVSLYNSYHPDLAFVDYWMTTDEHGVCNGAIARNGSNFILFLTPESDLKEISSFMRVAGATGILCSGEYALDFTSQQATGVIMKRNEPIPIEETDYEVCEPDIQSAYDLICKCADENFEPPAFDDFYVDVNHKLRHNAMRLYGMKHEGRLAAVAMTVAESDDGAVLGAVACDPDFRRMSFGSMIVKYITNRIVAENKTVFLHRAKNANAAFYNNLGFADCGTWREYKL